MNQPRTEANAPVDYLQQRASRADRGIFRRLLSRVPDVPPRPGDELPTDGQHPAPPNPPDRLRGGSRRQRTP